MMDWGRGHADGGDWVVMVMMMILLWGLIVASVFWVVRSLGSDRTPAASPDELLARRFARGEIDADEFRRSRQLLHSGD
jgi:putative membrane protein